MFLFDFIFYGFIFALMNLISVIFLFQHKFTNVSKVIKEEWPRKKQAGRKKNPIINELGLEKMQRAST